MQLDARTDYAMLMGLVSLLLAHSGPRSPDDLFERSVSKTRAVTSGSALRFFLSAGPHWPAISLASLPRVPSVRRSAGGRVGSPGRVQSGIVSEDT